MTDIMLATFQNWKNSCRETVLIHAQPQSRSSNHYRHSERRNEVPSSHSASVATAGQRRPREVRRREPLRSSSPTAIYEDRFVRVTATVLRIKHYYFPLRTSRDIHLDSVRGVFWRIIKRKEDGCSMAPWLLWCGDGELTWWASDSDREWGVIGSCTVRMELGEVTLKAYYMRKYIAYNEAFVPVSKAKALMRGIMAYRALTGMQRRDRSASLPSYVPEQIGRRRGSSGLHDLSENLPYDYDPDKHVDRFHRERPESGRPMNLIEDDDDRAPNIRIGASVAGANMAQLGADCRRLINIGADFLRFDLIDGSFSPGELTFGPTALAAVRQYLGPNVLLDAHLMVSNSVPYIEKLSAAGANRIILHYESAKAEELCNSLANIRALGMKAGLAVLPKTAVGLLLTFADVIDFAVVLTADPAEPHKFLPLTLDKVRRIRKEHPTLEIEVTGAVGPSNIQGCAAAGANSFAASMKATASGDPAVIWHQMHANIIRDIRERRPSYHLTDYYNLIDDVSGVDGQKDPPAGKSSRSNSIHL